MRFYRAECRDYKKYPNSFLHPFEKKKIKKAIDRGIMSSKALEIVERWEKENKTRLNYDNYEDIYSEDYMDDSLFYFLNGKLVFTTEDDARFYGTHIACCDYIVEYTGENSFYIGCEPSRDDWKKGTGRIYFIENAKEVSIKEI